MRGARGDACQEIENAKAYGPQAVFQCRAEDVERPHVEDDVQPASMHKRVGEKGREIGGRQAHHVAPAGTEVTAWHQGVLVQEILELRRAQTELIEEDGNVQPYDGPDDERIAGSPDAVSNREHCSQITLLPCYLATLLPCCLAALVPEMGTTRARGKFPGRRVG